MLRGEVAEDYGFFDGFLVIAGGYGCQAKAASWWFKEKID